MKLVYLTNARIPTEKAHGIQIMKMCEAFGNAGVELELVLPWRFNQIKENSFDFYGVKKSFKIKKIFSLDFIFLNIPKIFFWVQSLSFSISAFFYLLFKKTDIIYSRDSFLLYLISFFKKNLILELHYLPKHLFLHKRVFKKAKAVIVITKQLKKSLIEKGISENKILVAPDGVDIGKFDIDILKDEARKKLNLPQNKKIVLYSGHLYKWKGAQILANASKFLEKDTIVVFVGGTKEDEERFRDKNKNLNNILILGHRPYSEIPYYLKAADVLVLPNSGKEEISKSWTSPMKMFEYMASQRPIVASDLISLREILNENNAVLVEPDNSRALAEGIMSALKKDDFSAKILIEAWQNVQKYTWTERVKNILLFIKPL
ncbi:glycosyltransferase [Candidatus Parcubacteria bacterium]|nr:glycosyltransferase [Patescibacteria group bacterium]MBU4321558.1 glycosyltransferase [Nitrospinota bacterium]MCG2699676.1 glycosyltransferase [Candidatus Parcubacteria bacterium]